MKEIKRLVTTFLDVEVSPMQSMTYGPFHEASILEVVRAPYIFCFSYADIDNKRPRVVALPDFPLYKKEPYNDREVVKKLYEVISSADRIVAHNIAFDMRIARARFIFHKLPPVKPVKTICTLKLARKIGLFPANTLKEVALYLGVKHKMETSKNLWQDIHFRKDPKAWRQMKRYNRIDTEVGIQIYKILRGWTGKIKEKQYNAICKECGSNSVQLRGQTYTKKNGKRFQCLVCLAWGQFTL